MFIQTNLPTINDMDNLYNDLAKVYEAMYHSFIDYQEEYDFYSTILKKYNKKSILEIGSGTGNLAGHLVQNGFDYTGLDLSQAMVDLAKSKVSAGKFVQGDMRYFKSEKPVESILVPSRTINHLLTGEDINTTFSCFHHNLQQGGILCFDFIDAGEFMPLIWGGKKVMHEAVFEDTYYCRESIWTPTLEHGMDFNWTSFYFKKENEQLINIGEDSTQVRTFTVQEMEIFLKVHHFTVKEITARTSYAFPTYVVVAERD